MLIETKKKNATAAVLPQLTLEAVRQELLSMPIEGCRPLAIGIFGSLARGEANDRSDIDVFVVMEGRGVKKEANEFWYRKISEALACFSRDVTVIVYSEGGLKEINNWYVLRLAVEGVLVKDDGGVADLFRRIIAAAHKKGLEIREIGGAKVWAFSQPPVPGCPREVKVD